MEFGNAIIINPFFIYLLILMILIVGLIFFIIQKKRRLILITSCTLALLIFPVIWLLGQFIPENVSRGSMVEEFIANRECFDSVSTFVVNHGEDSEITYTNGEYKIKKFDGPESVSEEITDKNVKEDIRFILRKLKYKYIYFSDGLVIFTRTSNHMGICQMIIHPINDFKTYEQNEEMQAIEDGWFYFEGR